MLIEFGEWLPDLPSFLSPGCDIATNVVPHFKSYKPFLDLGTAASSALGSRAFGAVAYYGNDNNTYSFAGTQTALSLLQTGTYTDVSLAGSYSLDGSERWEFARFNNKCLACNINTVTQQFALSSATTNFSNLAVSTLQPKARHIAVLNDQFVVLGNVNEGGVGYPNRLRWSGIGDETTYDQSSTTLSDYQDLQGDYGPIQKIVTGSEYGVVISLRAIHRMTFSPSAKIFDILLVERNRGTIAPGSVVSWGAMVFFLDSDGFYVFDGSRSVPISHGKVSKWFFTKWSSSYAFRMSGAIDPVNSVVYWAFVSAANSNASPDPDMVLMYHWPSQRWSVASVNTELLFQGVSTGVTLDQLPSLGWTNLDTIPYSLDSSYWNSGTASIACIDTAHKMNAFSGSALAAVLESSRQQLFRGKRALVNGFRPLVDGGTLTGQIAPFEKLNDAQAYGASASQETDGLIAVTDSARYHQFRVSIAAGGSWTHAQGIDVDAIEDGDYGV